MKVNLEKFIVSNFENKKDAPKEYHKIFDEETKLGVPTAIGFHEDYGWFVIQSSGQGPYLIASEKTP